MKRFFFLLKYCFLTYVLFLVLASCSSSFLNSSKNEISYNVPQNYQIITEYDYVDHLDFIAREFVKSKTQTSSLVNIAEEQKKYLKGLCNIIFNSNKEFFGDSAYYPNFYILKDKRPFVFSLPRGHIFLSTGLIKKYIRYEELLVSLLSYEIIKNNKLIYKKETLVPIDYYELDRIIYLTKVPVEIKFEINQWAYYLLKRSKRDASAYLAWIQVQNKNALDFVTHLGDTQDISREEFLFKNFIVSKGIVKNSTSSDGNIEEDKSIEKNSSTNFYSFLKSFMRGDI